MRSVIKKRSIIFLAVVAVCFFVAFAVCFFGVKTVAAADIPITVEGNNTIFQSIGAGQVVVDANGDDRGVKLSSDQASAEFQTPFLTSGTAKIAFYITEYTSAEEYASKGRCETIIMFTDVIEGVMSRYQVMIYQVYEDGVHQARYALFYFHGSDPETITADTCLDCTYDEIVDRKLEVVVTFNASDTSDVWSVSIKAGSNAAKEITFARSANFDVYLYETGIIEKGEIVVSRFNTFSLANTYSEQTGKRTFNTVLGEGGYVSDTGDGIIPDAVEKGETLRIHKTKLCFAFFVGVPTYEITLSKNSEQIALTVDGDYYTYTFSEKGTYTFAITVTVVAGAETFNKTKNQVVICSDSGSETDIPITVEGNNTVFQSIGSGQVVVDSNGDDRGVKLSSNQASTEFRTPFYTSGKATIAFYPVNYTSAEEYASKGRCETVILFTSIIENVMARYQLMIYQVYENGVHQARYALFYFHGSDPEQKIVADYLLDCTYDEIVNDNLEVLVTFNASERAAGWFITIAVENYQTKKITFTRNANFDIYLYETGIIEKGEIVVSRFNTFSLANTYSAQTGKRTFNTVLGENGYVSDTGDGIIPDTVEKGEILRIHKTKLCFAFFVGVPDYEITIYKNGEQVSFIDDGDYYSYTFTENVDYSIVVDVTVLSFHKIVNYAISCEGVAVPRIDDLFLSGTVVPLGVAIDNGDINERVKFGWATTANVMNGKTEIRFRATELPDYVLLENVKTFNFLFGNTSATTLFQVNLYCENYEMRAFINVCQDYGHANAYTHVGVRTALAINQFTEYFVVYDPVRGQIILGNTEERSLADSFDLDDAYPYSSYAYGFKMGVNSGESVITGLNDLNLSNVDGRIEKDENLFCLDTVSVAYLVSETLSFNKNYYAFNYIYPLTHKSAKLFDPAGNEIALSEDAEDYSYTFTDNGLYLLRLTATDSFGTTTVKDVPIRVCTNEEVSERRFNALFDENSFAENLYTANGSRFYIKYEENNTKIYMPKVVVNDSLGLSYTVDVLITSVALGESVKLEYDENGADFFSAELLGSYNVVCTIKSNYGDITSSCMFSVVAVEEIPDIALPDKDVVSGGISRTDMYLLIILAEVVLIVTWIVIAKIRDAKKIKKYETVNK